MRKPTICGNNRVYVPDVGCTDCEELEVRIQALENRIARLPDEIVTYSLEGKDNEVTLVDSNGSESTVAVVAVTSCNN